MKFYHTGDLDYGGIRIFRHIREHICLEVCPYRWMRTGMTVTFHTVMK